MTVKWTIAATMFLVVCLTFLINVKLQRDSDIKSVEESLKKSRPDIVRIALDGKWNSIEPLAKNLSSYATSVAFEAKGNTVYSYPTESDQMTCSKPLLFPVQHYGVRVGQFALCFDTWAPVRRALTSIVFLGALFATLILTAFNSVVPLLGYKRSLFACLSLLKERADNPTTTPLTPTDLPVRDDLSVTLLNLIQKLLDRQISTEKTRALAQISALVAHDIRSPLELLDQNITKNTKLDEDTRKELCEMVNYVINITNDVVAKTRQSNILDGPELPTKALLNNEPQDIHPLSDLMAPIIEAKRLEISSRPSLTIESAPSADAYGLFVSVNATTFARALSNIINNSVQAITTGTGRIVITCSAQGDTAVIVITDNGCGISEEDLPKVTQMGATFGKKGGSGLGLFQADAAIKSWHGELKVDSKLNEGTTITISLPKTDPPAWFVSSIDITPASRIVVLDDNPGMHRIWRDRIQSLGLLDNGIGCLTFTNADDLINWTEQHRTEAQKATFLVDY
jgi:signal transduction histidine kinase